MIFDDDRYDVRITDTTLRDGSHPMAHRFTPDQVRDTVRALDDAGMEIPFPYRTLTWKQADAPAEKAEAR